MPMELAVGEFPRSQSVLEELNLTPGPLRRAGNKSDHLPRSGSFESRAFK